MASEQIIELSTKIDGYTAELEVTEHDDGTAESHCYVSRGPHSASLELLDAMGSFDDGLPGETVRPETIAKIRAWADANGY